MKHSQSVHHVAVVPEQPVHTVAPGQRSITLHQIGLLLIALAMMLLSVVMRAPTAGYVGIPDQFSFNKYIFQYVGAYSDITSLYFRDHLWNHPLPYFEYPLEYPVGMGVLIWLIGFVNDSVTSYLLASAVVLMACGLAMLMLGFRFKGANLWIFALSPTLPLYTVLNWDLYGILLTVAALLCFRRDRDRWGAVLLAAAVWAKFFPIVLVPLVLLDRVLRRRWRDVWWIGGLFAAASVLINAPFAIQVTDQGVQLRESWLHFFRFNQARPREVNFWNFFDGLGLTLEQINRASAVLLALGVCAIMLLMLWSYRRAAHRHNDLLLAASLAAIAWFFFINKVYSPQYSLWLVVFMALLAAPITLAVVFASIDVGYFAASFIVLYLSSTGNPATDWFHHEVLFRMLVLREAVIFAIIVWAVWYMLRSRRGTSSDGRPALRGR